MSDEAHVWQREFRNEAVRLADLTVNTDRITGVSFENCQILGPAVILPVQNTQISYSGFDGPDPDSLFWVIPDSRQYVIGAVILIGCRIFQCRFVNVGVAVRQADLDAARRGLGIGD